MLQTAILDSQYYEEQEIRLSNITTLKVYNGGTTVAIINGIPVYPNQKEVIIAADGTFSNVILGLVFVSIEQIKKQQQQIGGIRYVLPTENNDGPKAEPEPELILINKIQFIYKKLI